MQSIKSIYKIGYGPSSSHTMGPQRASKLFKESYPTCTKYKAYLYGSLALTGKGHLTDWIVKKTLGEDICDVEFLYDEVLEYHPNAIKIEGYINNELIASETYFSIGGGDIVNLKDINKQTRNFYDEDIYPFSTMTEIKNFCKSKNISFLDFVNTFEDSSLDKHLEEVLEVMLNSAKEGISKTGILPGKLKINRRSNSLYNNYLENRDFDALVFASCIGVSEQNASGGVIVTAPTCGACGLIAGLCYSYHTHMHISKMKLIEGLKIAGLIGNLIRTNASISGAEVGCQGEVGSACSMAAGMLAYIFGGSLDQIEYASEIALEHSLGMTCDPVSGYVQIPCIERNAICAKRAIDSSKYSLLSDGIHYITLDHVIATMKETGLDLHAKYRETSLGGLASEKKC